ncbi:MAG: hypothetical protein ThorAB25_16370 [Candidatus Thorarchaeota archaeon AB_25]|nr:MAG: hypothetical protein ThorAB25_16370 [Candidatus Thorarchaeota archaeon AB_25]
MDIPVLTRFNKGLRLFFQSKRLRWLFFIFTLSAVFVLAFRELGNFFPIFAGGFIAIIGGIFPTFFMITAFLSLLGLQRFVASEESYTRSFVFFIIWIVISAFVYLMLWLSGMVFWILVGIAFLGWIGFQAYLSSRTALGYAESVQIKSRSRVVAFLLGTLHILSYVIVIGAFIILFIWYAATTALFDWVVVGAALIGALLALGFNFVNGFIMLRERKRVTVDNLALLGLFIAAYVAYFLYNILKPVSASIDLFSLLIDAGLSIFFLLYALSSVGLTLASRAEMDTRWKISGELAATLTFFFASGYLVVQALFGTLSGGLIGERIPDVIKLFVFPFVALVIELLFIRRSRKAPEPSEVPEEILVLTEDEPALSEEEPAVIDEPVEKEDVLLVPEEEYAEEPTEESEEPEPLEDKFSEVE